MGTWARLRHWASSPVVPSLWPEGAEVCPRCGRPIAGAIIPFRGSPQQLAGGFQKTDFELAALCPMEGTFRRGRDPSGRSIEELRSEAVEIAHELRAANDSGWSRLFDAAVNSEDPDAFLRRFGDALAVLIRHGPVGDLHEERAALEQLLIDTVGRWHPKGA
jgi:hypothetical protein